jgi:predicted transcriptional regulator
MMSDTATIRVSRETRDLLGEIARAKGVSVSALVTEWALLIERREAFRSEREATLADAANPEAMAEQRLWETANEDGID